VAPTESLEAAAEAAVAPYCECKGKELQRERPRPPRNRRCSRSMRSWVPLVLRSRCFGSLEAAAEAAVAPYCECKGKELQRERQQGLALRGVSAVEPPTLCPVTHEARGFSGDVGTARGIGTTATASNDDM